jgi:hypothetical protein
LLRELQLATVPAASSTPGYRWSRMADSWPRSLPNQHPKLQNRQVARRFLLIAFVPHMEWRLHRFI